MKKHYNRKNVVILLSVFLVIGLFFLVRWAYMSYFYVSTDDAQIKGNLIGVGVKISARVAEIKAEEGDKVEKGQLLAQLDGRDLEASLAQAIAAEDAARIEKQRFAQELDLIQREAEIKVDAAGNLLSSSGENLNISEQELMMQKITASADLDRQKAELEVAKANYAQLQAVNIRASRDASRAAQLFNKGAISKQSEEELSTNYITTQEKSRAAKENVREQENLLEIANSRLRNISIKESQYKTSKNNLATSYGNVELAQISASRARLDYQKLKVLSAKLKEAEAKVKYYKEILKETIVISPASGIVARRNVRLGEVTAPGVPLFYIADSSQIWVTANIEESKIQNIHLGANVNIHIDAYPNQKFKGKVEFIGPTTSSEFSLFPSDNPSGTFIKVTHRIPVRIKVDASSGFLKPGMNAVVDISKH